ncbi:MAG: DUF364 domain-containing protein [Methanothermobacter thermautotrophicus]
MIHEFIRDKMNYLIHSSAMESTYVEISVKNPLLDTSTIKDYPLVEGREVMLRATLEDGTVGECFTATPTHFRGTLGELLVKGEQSCLIATFNALMRKKGFIDRTVHCTGNAPERCAELLSDYLELLGYDRVALLGFQPAFVRKLHETFGDRLQVTDLNPGNKGKKYGVDVFDAKKSNKKIIHNSDVLVVTGSTVANGTFEDIMAMASDKRVIFYGTTIAGLAALMGVERFCPLSE